MKDGYKIEISQVNLDEMDKARNVIFKFTQKISSEIVGQQDKMFTMLLNDKPKRMTQKNWEKMLRKVLKVEVIDRLNPGLHAGGG